MIRRILLALIASVLLMALAGCASNPLLPGEIRFSYAELTERMAKRFPQEKSIAGLLDVTLSNPRLAARDDAAQRRLAATFDVQVKVPLTGKTLFGIVSMSGVPRYDVEGRALYLGGARVDSLRTDNMPDGLSAALGKAASTIAKESLEDRPLYNFKAEDLQRYSVTLTPLRVEVRSEGIALIMR